MILKIKLNLPNFIDESRRLNELEISNHASLCSQRLYLRLDRLPAEVRHVAVVVTVLVLGHILLQGRNGNLLRQLKRNILEKQLFVKFKDERLFSFRVFSRASSIFTDLCWVRPSKIKTPRQLKINHSTSSPPSSPTTPTHLSPISLPTPLSQPAFNFAT